MDENIQLNMMSRVAMGDCLRRTAKRFPNNIAVKFGEKTMSYMELNEKANQFGHSLLKQNLPKGSKIAFVAPNCIEFFIAFFGCAKSGMVMVTINPMFNKSEMSFAVNDTDCELFIFDGAVLPLIEGTFDEFKKIRQYIAFNSTSDKFVDFYGLLDSCSTDEVEVLIDDRDVVTICFTGGTTSFPKGAQLTHLNLFANVSSAAMDLHFEPDDRVGIVLPLFHIATLICTMFVISTGGTVVFIPQVDPRVILNTIQDEKLTMSLVMPTLFRPILLQPDFDDFDLSSLNLVIYFGAVMPVDLMQEVMEKFCPKLALAFGQTEMSPCVTIFKPEHHLTHPKSLGMSTVHCEIEVMDTNGNILPRGETGEFVYRSPSLMKGYYKKDEINKEAFAYGWFHSGDLGYLDEDNFLYFTDRKKDMIKTGGENVASIEVEKTIYLDQRVMEAYVVGLNHERWSEAITAFIVPKPGETITEEEIISLCKDKMVGYKVPKRVIFLKELPKSSVGKVLKFKLKETHKDLYQGEN